MEVQKSYILAKVNTTGLCFVAAGRNDLPAGKIAGAVVGSVLGFSIIVIVAVIAASICIKKKSNGKEPDSGRRLCVCVWGGGGGGGEGGGATCEAGDMEHYVSISSFPAPKTTTDGMERR